MKMLGIMRERFLGNRLAVSLGISVLLNVCLAIILVMMSSSLSEKDQQLDKLTSWFSYTDNDIKIKTTELSRLQKDLERIKLERENLGLSNDSLNQQLIELKTTIAELEKKPELDHQEKLKLEQLISKLRRQVIEKDQQIAVLKKQNDSLVTDVNKLRAETENLNHSLDSTESIIKLASVLKAEGIEVEGLKSNGNAMWANVYRGKRLDRVRITFSLADNKIARKGMREIYVALQTPEGKIFSDYLNGGGMVTLHDGRRMPYTMSTTIAFNNKREKVSFTMLKGFDYKPGDYKLIVYSDGFKIGEGEFSVR